MNFNIKHFVFISVLLFGSTLFSSDKVSNEKYINVLSEVENILEENHFNFSQNNLQTLVSLNKYSEAYKYSKKLEKKSLSSFESELIIGFIASATVGVVSVV